MLQCSNDMEFGNEVCCGDGHVRTADTWFADHLYSGKDGVDFSCLRPNGISL
jgi:hypothetical protein